MGNIIFLYNVINIDPYYKNFPFFQEWYTSAGKVNPK